MRIGAIVITALLIAAVPAIAATTPTGKSAQEIRDYYDSGDWNTAIGKQVAKAKAYLGKRIHGKHAPKKPALVLDIDETALNNVVCLEAKNGIPYDAGIYAGCVGDLRRARLQAGAEPVQAGQGARGQGLLRHRPAGLTRDGSSRT